MFSPSYLPAASRSKQLCCADPLLYMLLTVDAGRRRDALYLPSVSVRLLPVHVALAEGGPPGQCAVAKAMQDPLMPFTAHCFAGTLWRMLACMQALAGAAGAASSGAAQVQAQRGRSAGSGSAPWGSRSTHEQVSADLPLALNFLNLEDIVLQLSYRPDKGSRPRFANQVRSLLLTIFIVALVAPGVVGCRGFLFICIEHSHNIVV